MGNALISFRFWTEIHIFPALLIFLQFEKHNSMIFAFIWLGICVLFACKINQFVICIKISQYRSIFCCFDIFAVRTNFSSVLNLLLCCMNCIIVCPNWVIWVGSWLAERQHKNEDYMYVLVWVSLMTPLSPNLCWSPDKSSRYSSLSISVHEPWV